MINVILNGKKIDSIDNFYEVLDKYLNFPPYFGKNLDALYDVLSEDNRTIRFIIKNHLELESTLGEFYFKLLVLLEDLSNEYSNISLKIK